MGTLCGHDGMYLFSSQIVAAVQERAHFGAPLLFACRVATLHARGPNWVVGGGWGIQCKSSTSVLPYIQIQIFVVRI